VPFDFGGRGGGSVCTSECWFFVYGRALGLLHEDDGDKLATLHEKTSSRHTVVILYHNKSHHRHRHLHRRY